jgi:hypothetical protein
MVLAHRTTATLPIYSVLAVAAVVPPSQFESGSSYARFKRLNQTRFIICKLHALKPNAVNMGSSWDQPAPPYLDLREVCKIRLAPVLDRVRAAHGVPHAGVPLAPLGRHRRAAVPVQKGHWEQRLERRSEHDLPSG